MGRIRTFEINDEVFVAHLKYHTSWDWLMPVVFKVRGIEHQFKKKSGVWFTVLDCSGYQSESEFREAVWLAIVEFLNQILK
jgi:hypothetical protein